MTPVFKVEANGEDVTEKLQANTVSISFSDEDGNQSDEITIVVAGDFNRPKYKDELKLWLGYEEREMFECGLFVVQRTKRSRFGLTITATGADFSNALKQKRDLSYEQLSLKEVAKMVADRHGLKLKSDFGDLQVTHLSQTDESDLHFMKRISTDYNGIFSIKNATLIFLKRIKGTSPSSELPHFKINVDEESELEIEYTNKTFYGSCVATWHDTTENKVQSITVGSGDPVLKLDAQFKSAAEANTKAMAKLARASRGTKSGSLSVYGQEIYAGGVLEISGAGEDDGKYSIKRVEHSFDDGWSMRVEFEN